MKIFVCPCAEKEKSMAALPSVTAALRKYGITPVFDRSVYELYRDERAEYSESDDIIGECDMLLTVGGDGMMLKWGKKAAFAGKPLIGINTGRLGFMTAVDSDCLDKLSALTDGSCSFSTRMMLSADLSGEEITALNDIVLFKDVNSKLPEFTVRINGITVTKVRADGLIFSTPTGSTAYALSAGGPIIEPTVECIQLTHLCAHTLLNRPMIFSGTDVVTVSYAPYEGSRVNMSVDGANGTEFPADAELVIRKSPVALRIAEIGERSFYSTVSEKLMTPLK
ncbi:MAG TPA: sugar kinase [Ruminococcaceae bacterium]|nr:sugar kinase [Oscillospiraceae bacterium]